MHNFNIFIMEFGIVLYEVQNSIKILFFVLEPNFQYIRDFET